MAPWNESGCVKKNSRSNTFINLLTDMIYYTHNTGEQSSCKKIENYIRKVEKFKVWLSRNGKRNINITLYFNQWFILTFGLYFTIGSS